MADWLSKQINNVKDKYHKHGENELYINNYKPGEAVFGWSKYYIQSMESRTVSAKLIINWKKWFSAWNQYVYDCHVKRMNKFVHNVYEENYTSSDNYKSEEDYEKEE